MIIGIDGNEANVEKRVGIGEYAFELLMQFSNSKFINSINSKQNFKFVIYLKDQPVKDLPKQNEKWSYRIIGPRKLWTQFALPFDLFVHPRPDVFFTPTHYAPRFSPIPTAISIMDVSFLYYPELFRKQDLFQLKHWTAYSAKKAKKIFTISNMSRSDIIKKYALKDEKVVVTYPGLKETASFKDIILMDELHKKFGVENEYILFVGTIQPRKNIDRLIEAFAVVIKEEKTKNLDLVIIGKKGWLYSDIINKPQQLGIQSQVRFLDFVSDKELSSFYKHAIFFVLPSLYEGFGLPVLEAMKLGCPVITSNISSLPEAGGDAALYVDPNSVEDIAEKMSFLLNDKKKREELARKGYDHIKQFSWEKTAQRTLKELENMVISKQ